MKSVIALVIVLAAAATGFGGDRRLPRAATVERPLSQAAPVCEGGVCRVGGAPQVQQAQFQQYAQPAPQSVGGSGCQNGQCAPQSFRRSGPVRRLFGF